MPEKLQDLCPGGRPTSVRKYPEVLELEVLAWRSAALRGERGTIIEGIEGNYPRGVRAAHGYVS